MKLYPDMLQRTGYRLPTEAEWEYACRAGAVTSRYYGQSEALLTRYAWYLKNSQHRWLLPVGSLKPNDLGLFDMLGNALECCHDRALVYPTGQQTTQDGEWYERSGTVSDRISRVLRGGSFTVVGQGVRAAIRDFNVPVLRGYNLGFRPARTYITYCLNGIMGATGPSL